MFEKVLEGSRSVVEPCNTGGRTENPVLPGKVTQSAVLYIYQPSGSKGTRSPSATPHLRQNPKWPPVASKLAEGVSFSLMEKSWIFGSDFDLMGLFRWNGNKLKQFLYLIKSFWKLLFLAFNFPLRLHSLLAQWVSPGSWWDTSNGSIKCLAKIMV